MQFLHLKDHQEMWVYFIWTICLRIKKCIIAQRSWYILLKGFLHAASLCILSVELIICAVLSQAAPVQWCGPDGSVVLIRAVRSGLDRVVLELLRAGVPVNNTDHTGKSAINPCMWNESLQSKWSSRIHYRNSFCFLCSWGVMCFALSGFVFVTVSVLNSPLRSSVSSCFPRVTPAPLINTSDSEHS